MAKTKLEKHLQELEEMTSGGAHDAVTFSGRGLGFLRDLFKSSKKKGELEDEDELEENDDEDSEEDEDEGGEKMKKTKKSVQKNAHKTKKSQANDHCIECPECGCECDMGDNFCPNCGCDLSECKEETKKHNMANMKKSEHDCIECPECGEECDIECNYCPECGCCLDEDSGIDGVGGIGRRDGGDLSVEPEGGLSDPGQRGMRQVITNHGRRVNGKGAVKKNARFNQFEEEYADVLDASDVLKGLTKNVRVMAESTSSTLDQLQDQNMQLAKAVHMLLKSNASLASDVELIKKQPAAVPANGIVMLSKGRGNKQVKLSKSELQDTLTDLMNEGIEEAPTLLKKLGTVRSDFELKSFVDDLPVQIRERL